MVSKDQSENVKKNVSLFKLVFAFVVRKNGKNNKKMIAAIPLFHRFGLLDLSTHEKIIIIS